MASRFDFFFIGQCHQTLDPSPRVAITVPVPELRTAAHQVTRGPQRSRSLDDGRTGTPLLLAVTEGSEPNEIYAIAADGFVIRTTSPPWGSATLVDVVLAAILTVPDG